jgi:hypothetical protein
VNRTGDNRLMPGQSYRWDVAVSPNAFPPIFLLSQWRLRMRVVVAETHAFD